MARDPSYQDPSHMFLASNGAPFKCLSKWYRDLHVRHRAPYSLLPLNDYRQVFVTDRMEDPDRAGPSNEGAATIMGNTVRQWEASYWKNKRIKVAKEATKALGAYRDSHLREAGHYD
jgi:hypothetical protein